MNALIGLTVLAAAVWVVRILARRAAAGGVAFLASEAAATVCALLLTAWVSGGVALLISGTVGLFLGTDTTAIEQ